MVFVYAHQLCGQINVCFSMRKIPNSLMIAHTQLDCHYHRHIMCLRLTAETGDIFFQNERSCVLLFHVHTTSIYKPIYKTDRCDFQGNPSSSNSSLYYSMDIMYFYPMDNVYSHVSYKQFNAQSTICTFEYYCYYIFSLLKSLPSKSVIIIIMQSTK